jgi:hypothetical protein
VLPLGRFGSIRLHQWLRSDDERAAHDHPSDFLTLVLFGGYVDALEHADGSQSYDRLAVAAVRYRRAEHRHRVVLTHSPTWTLLYFAPARRDWGFYKRRAIGGFRFLRQHKWFASFGHHPCDQQ